MDNIDNDKNENVNIGFDKVMQTIMKIRTVDFCQLRGTGGEVRRKIEEYNNLVENELSYSNVVLKKLDKTLDEKYTEIKEREGYLLRTTAKPVCEFIYYATRDFFERNGYVKGRKIPDKVQNFFRDGYDFLVRHLGDNGDRNILAAYIHLDETVPHLQAYFIPVSDRQVSERRQYAGKGKCVYEKGEDGKIIHTEKKLDKKVISWGNVIRVIGERDKFDGLTKLANLEHEEVGSRYGLHRSEMCIGKKTINSMQIRYRLLLSKIDEGNLAVEKLEQERNILAEEKNKLAEEIKELKLNFESLKYANELLKKALEKEKTMANGEK